MTKDRRCGARLLPPFSDRGPRPAGRRVTDGRARQIKRHGPDSAEASSRRMATDSRHLMAGRDKTAETWEPIKPLAPILGVTYGKCPATAPLCWVGKEQEGEAPQELGRGEPELVGVELRQRQFPPIPKGRSRRAHARK
jgi:hypothetical protein